MRKRLDTRLQAARVRTGSMASDDSYGLTGMFEISGPCGRQLVIIASEGDSEIPWEHVSVSLSTRTPNWTEMCFVKNLFWDPEEAVMQLHPPQSTYVNCHPFCLHLWRPWFDRIPLPNPIAVGTRVEVKE